MLLLQLEVPHPRPFLPPEGDDRVLVVPAESRDHDAASPLPRAQSPSLDRLSRDMSFHERPTSPSMMEEGGRLAKLMSGKLGRQESSTKDAFADMFANDVEADSTPVALEPEGETAADTNTADEAAPQALAGTDNVESSDEPKKAVSPVKAGEGKEKSMNSSWAESKPESKAEERARQKKEREEQRRAEAAEAKERAAQRRKEAEEKRKEEELKARQAREARQEKDRKDKDARRRRSFTKENPTVPKPPTPVESTKDAGAGTGTDDEQPSEKGSAPAPGSARAGSSSKKAEREKDPRRKSTSLTPPTTGATAATSAGSRSASPNPAAGGPQHSSANKRTGVKTPPPPVNIAKPAAATKNDKPKSPKSSSSPNSPKSPKSPISPKSLKSKQGSPGPEKHHAAQRIQLTVRRKQAVKRTAEQRRKLQEAQKRVGMFVHWAVVTIQRNARGKMGRKKYEKHAMAKRVRKLLRILRYFTSELYVHSFVCFFINFF